MIWIHVIFISFFIYIYLGHSYILKKSNVPAHRTRADCGVRVQPVVMQFIFYAQVDNLQILFELLVSYLVA